MKNKKLLMNYKVNNRNLINLHLLPNNLRVMMIMKRTRNKEAKIKKKKEKNRNKRKKKKKKL
jgi:hypothetical protein